MQSAVSARGALAAEKRVSEWWSAPSSKKFLMSPAGNVRRKRLPALADIVAKVFLGWRRKILRAADAFYARRLCVIQNRSRGVVALKSDAAAEIDFRGFLGLFDFRLLQQYRDV